LSGKATNACKTVGSLPLNTLFRIDNMWYRNIKMGKVCTVTVVGQKREIEMSGNMAISAVSVMNLV
jgi:hypothetical protein